MRGARGRTSPTTDEVQCHPAGTHVGHGLSGGGRFGATDHDQLVVAFEPASGNAIVATIDFEDSSRKVLEVNPELSWRCGRNELRTL